LSRQRDGLVIASRRSPLARRQAVMVAEALRRTHGGLTVGFFWITSDGDRDRSAGQRREDAKGIFTRAVDRAIIDGNADLAVHSMKDMPLSLRNRPRGLVVAAVPMRGPVADCLVSTDGPVEIDALKNGAVVGTSSPRRAAQLLRRRPDLVIRPVAGNVQRRLDQVHLERRFDATVLASAGLARLGLQAFRTVELSVEEMLPAAAQGALALQCSATDVRTIRLCLPLVHASSAVTAHAEQAVMAALGGDCHSAMAALAEVGPGGARLRARVLSPDGTRCLESDVMRPASAPMELVGNVVASLKDQGATALVHPVA